MENNANTTTNIEAGVGTDATTVVYNKTDLTTDDMISMSKIDYEKELQSEADKVRSKAAKDIKALQAKISELAPAEKSQADIDLENRLAAIEAREQTTAAKEKMLNMQTVLTAKGLDKSLADFLRTDDIDIEAFGTIIDSIVNDRAKSAGYVPSGHQSNAGVTADEFKKMSYSAKVKLNETYPELVKQFLGK